MTDTLHIITKTESPPFEPGRSESVDAGFLHECEVEDYEAGDEYLSLVYEDYVVYVSHSEIKYWGHYRG